MEFDVGNRDRQNRADDQGAEDKHILADFLADVVMTVAMRGVTVSPGLTWIRSGGRMC